MGDLVKKIKIKKQDGTFTDYIPIGAEAQNIDVDGESVTYKLNKKPYYYNTVADMKADTKLKAGDMAVTLGYYSANDGGNGEYRIVSGSYTDDGGSYHELDNSLWAELIIKNDTINVKQFGAYGDNTHDDSTYIQKVMNFVNKEFVYFPKGFYTINQSIDCSNKIINIKGNGKSYGETVIYVKQQSDIFINIASNSNIESIFFSGSKNYYIDSICKGNLQNIRLFDVKVWGAKSVLSHSANSFAGYINIENCNFRYCEKVLYVLNNQSLTYTYFKFSVFLDCDLLVDCYKGEEIVFDSDDIERCACMIGYSGESTTLSFVRPIIIENCYFEGTTVVDDTLYNNTQHQYNLITISDSYIYYNFTQEQIDANNSHLDTYGLYNHPFYLRLAHFSNTTNQQIIIRECQLVGKNGTTCIQGSQVGIVFHENNSCNYVTAESTRFNRIKYNFNGIMDHSSRVNFNDGIKIGNSAATNLDTSIGVLKLRSSDGMITKMANGSYNHEANYISGVIPTTFITANANGYPYHTINEELAFIFNKATHQLLVIYDGKMYDTDGNQVYPQS